MIAGRTGSRKALPGGREGHAPSDARPLLDHWEPSGKGRALAGSALHLDAAAVRLCDFECHGEPETRAVDPVLASAALEALEDPIQLVSWNPVSRMATATRDPSRRAVTITEGWKGPMDVEPGMVKWLHLAGGYGHLRYWPLQWQPVPIDRAVRIDIEKAT